MVNEFEKPILGWREPIRLDNVNRNRILPHLIATLNGNREREVEVNRQNDDVLQRRKNMPIKVVSWSGGVGAFKGFRGLKLRFKLKRPFIRCPQKNGLGDSLECCYATELLRNSDEKAR